MSFGCFTSSGFGPLLLVGFFGGWNFVGVLGRLSRGWVAVTDVNNVYGTSKTLQNDWRGDPPKTL